MHPWPQPSIQFQQHFNRFHFARYCLSITIKWIFDHVLGIQFCLFGATTTTTTTTKNTIQLFSARYKYIRMGMRPKRPILLCTNISEQVNSIRSLLLLSFATIDYGQLQFFLVTNNQMSLGRWASLWMFVCLMASICILQTQFT